MARRSSSEMDDEPSESFHLVSQEPIPSTSSFSPQQNKRRSTRANITKSSVADEALDEMIKTCVRCVIFKASTGLPIKRSQLQELTTKNAKAFNVVLDRAKFALKDIYGYELYALNEKVKCYSVSNILPHIEMDSDEEDDDENGKTTDNAENVLLMLILAHIFMSNGCCSHEALFDYLKGYHILYEEIHDIFGSIKERLKSFVNMKYISIETGKGTADSVYKWGQKAEQEVSKLELLKFVAMSSGRKTESYNVQYTEAMKQFKNDEEKNIEVDEADPPE